MRLFHSINIIFKIMLKKPNPKNIPDNIRFALFETYDVFSCNVPSSIIGSTNIIPIIALTLIDIKASTIKNNSPTIIPVHLAHTGN